MSDDLTAQEWWASELELEHWFDEDFPLASPRVPRLYYVVYPSAGSAPSAAQVRAGQDSTGSPAVASGNELAPTASGAYNFAVDAAGLTPATSYRVALVWGWEGNSSNVVVSSAFTTLSGGGITGTLAATETGGDTAAISGQIIVSGTLAAAESGADTAAITGDVIVAGTLAATEAGADTAAITGDVIVSGSLAATEAGVDTATITGVVVVAGSLAATEAGNDTATITGGAVAAGTLAATEAGDDVAAIEGTVSAGITGDMAAVEGDPSAVWSYVLSNGLTAEETLVQLHAYVRELYQIHGLEAGTPLVITSVSRVAGAIEQSVSEAGGTVTVERL